MEQLPTTNPELNLRENPVAQIEQAFNLLEFTILMDTLVRIKQEFPPETFREKLGRVRVDFDLGCLWIDGDKFGNQGVLDWAVENNVRVAHAFTALVLDEALRQAEIAPKPERKTGFIAIRNIVYQVRHAYAHGPMFQHWNLSKKYRTVYTLTLRADASGSRDFEVNLSDRHGTPFHIKHIGDNGMWIAIKEECCRELRERMG